MCDPETSSDRRPRRIAENFATILTFSERTNILIGGLSSLSSGQSTSRPQASDDRRPNAVERFSDHAGFLAGMPGVRREAVNKSAIILQKRNLIGYNRGKIQIPYRANLEKTSCPCYFLIKAGEQSFPVN